MPASRAGLTSVRATADMQTAKSPSQPFLLPPGEGQDEGILKKQGVMQLDLRITEESLRTSYSRIAGTPVIQVTGETDIV